MCADSLKSGGNKIKINLKKKKNKSPKAKYGYALPVKNKIAKKKLLIAMIN